MPDQTFLDRGSAGLTLPAGVSQDILAATLEESAVMALVRKVSLPGTGVAIPVITGEPQAEWVGEGEDKPVSTATLSMRRLVPYKLAVIEAFSQELTRDLASLYNELRRRLPYALGRVFDETVFGFMTAPGSDFDTLAGAPSASLAADAYEGLVAAKNLITTAGGILNGWALSPQAQGVLDSALDSVGRPIFLNSATDGSPDRLLGQPVKVTKAAYRQGTPNVVGIAGDWTSAVWGAVNSVQISFSDQATLKVGDRLLSLFQSNMVAIRAEVEVGFATLSASRFAKLTQ